MPIKHDTDWEVAMIHTTDAGDRIKVYEIISAKSGIIKRDYIGSIKKKDAIVPPEIRDRLSDESLNELSQIISVYRTIPDDESRLLSRKMPDICRQVSDYVNSRADLIELTMLLNCLTDLQRDVNKRKSALVGKQSQLDRLD